MVLKMWLVQFTIANLLVLCVLLASFTASCSAETYRLLHKRASLPAQYDEPVTILYRPCVPSPCGPNSQCRESNGQAVCSCVPGSSGFPPTCRLKCESTSECSLDKACVNRECKDPCPDGTCGLSATCQVVNHSPICSCPPQYTGDPFDRCSAIESCRPRCGPNAQCKEVDGSSSCSCLPEFVGSPPNCRPECVSNSECANHLACIKQKCKDPCPDVCGRNSECSVVSHTPNCVCLPGYIGNPFFQCQLPAGENESSHITLPTTITS